MMQTHDRSELLVGYSVALIVLSSILVILRLISRRLSAAKFWWDDTLIVISLVGLKHWTDLSEFQ